MKSTLLIAAALSGCASGQRAAASDSIQTAAPTLVAAGSPVSPNGVTAAPPQTGPGPSSASGPESSTPFHLTSLNTPGGSEVDLVGRADDLLARGQSERALAELATVRTPAGDLLRTRAYRMLGTLDAALGALSTAEQEEGLRAYVDLERGLIAWEQGDAAVAARELLPLLELDRSIAQRGASVLVEALAASDPAALLQHAAEIEKCLPKSDPDARSLWLEGQAVALDKLGRGDEARAMRLRRYLEEPVSTKTPGTPPQGVTLVPEQIIKRAEVLNDAHRSEQVLSELEALSEQTLSDGQRCRRSFALGLAARKLRRYASAEKQLTKAVEQCKDEEQVRRALYLRLRVVTIPDGQRALGLIDEFAKRYAGHSMVDDALFWAGEIHQKRKIYDAAARYFRAAEEQPQKGDYCGEARWRLAWIAFARGRLDEAEGALKRVLLDDGCVTERFDRARAAYWLARFADERGKPDAALYAQTVDTEPLGFYAQMALKRLQTLDPQRAAGIVSRLAPPQQVEVPALCPGFLAAEPGFTRGVELLRRGLKSDAAGALLAISVPTQEVLGSTHALALGVEPKRPASLAAANELQCGASAPLLLFALLLDRAGAFHDAHWRLRTDFANILSRYPSGEDFTIWRAAYPLAFRAEIAAAEQESGLPNLFLQALCREESALDPGAVSWAGAYGLTQLLLSSSRAAGKLLTPPVTVERAEQLLQPAFSARLGGALLGYELKKFGGNAALALAAYNAGDDVAIAWWNKHQGRRFDLFAEEMTIKETRGYVARVLKTYGIYRWLYAGEAPTLPIALTLPSR